MGKKAGAKAAASKKGGKVEEEEDIDAILNAAVKAAGNERKKAAQVSKSGEQAAAKGDWEKAIEHFAEAIQSDPNDGAHYRRRSAAYAGAGRHAEALADARAAADLAAKQSPAEGADCACQLGNVLGMHGKLQEALDAFGRGLKLVTGHKGCKQGRDDALEAMAQQGSGQLTLGKDDAEGQKLGTMPTNEDVLGRGFEVVRLKVGSHKESLLFLVSTVTTDEMVISPETCAALGRPIARSVDLQDVRFEGGGAIGNVTCQVTGFTQATIAQQALGVSVHGMVGLPFLNRFDLDLDRSKGEQRLKKAGAIAVAESASKGAQSRAAGAQALSCLELPNGLLGLPIQARHKQSTKPMLGIVDTSSMFSVISWQAAKELGIGDGPDDSKFANATKVVGLTANGTAEMPIVSIKVSIFGSPQGLGCKLGGISKEEFESEGKGNGWSVDVKAKDLKNGIECGRVNAAVGDDVRLQLLSDSTVGQFCGGAVLIGQDLLVQLPRLTISAKDKRLWADQPTRIVDCSPV